jgi:hypothetical protein
VIESVSYGGEELRREALSFGAASHIARIGEDSFKLDLTYGAAILNALIDITANGVEAYNCADERLRSMGLLSPWLLVDFDALGGGGGIYSLMLSVSPAGGGQYLIRRGGEDVVYRTGRLPFMEIDPGKLTARWYLSPLIMDLRGVTVEADGATLDFTFSGVSNADKSVTLDGAAFDISIFRKFYRLLISASSDGEPLNGTSGSNDEPLNGTSESGGGPLIKIEYRYLDGLKQPDIIEFQRGGPRRLTVSINGRQNRFGMHETYAKRVAEACEAIRNGVDFDENW